MSVHRARAAWAMLALLIAVPVGGAAEALRIVRVEFEGPPVEAPALMAALGAELEGEAATEEVLVEAVRRLEEVAGVGDVEVVRRRVDGGVEVVFRYRQRQRRISALRFAVPPERGLAGLSPAEVRRRVAAAIGPLHVEPGSVFHPFLARVDRDAIRRYLRERGYREARVDVAVAPVGPGLVRVTFGVRPGPLHVVEDVSIAGSTLGPAARAELRGELVTEEGEAVSEVELATDAVRVARAQCLRGHPEARAEPAIRPLPVRRADGVPVRPVEVRFEVAPGPFVRTGRVRVVGRRVPPGLLRTFRLQPEGPFCPVLVDEAVERIAAWLRERGVPDPTIEVETRPAVDAAGRRRVVVTFAVAVAPPARVERIWFRGNVVTHEDVLRQLLALREGEVFRASRLVRSVQAMRRSGLFRRVEAEVVDAPDPAGVYVYFFVEERELFGFRAFGQRIVFRNVAVGDWPEDMEAFEHGLAFRGGGQFVDIVAQADRQALLWRDPFILPSALARFGIERQEIDEDVFEEQWVQIEAGFGASLLEGAVTVIPFGQIEWADTEQILGPLLPLPEGSGWAAAVGLEGAFDFRLRDEERVPYLGLAFTIDGRYGWSLDRPDVDWSQYRARLDGDLPLWTTAFGRHGVLDLSVALSQVFTDNPERLRANRRIFPQLRGYDDDGVGLLFEIGAEDVVLGGFKGAAASAEIRVPLPGWRNAVLPFYDVGSVSDDGYAELLDELHHAVGVAVAFTLLDETFEARLWVAYPFRREAERQFVGGTFGGNL